MENKYIQPLLKSGLLDLGDSDERLAHIEASIADLATKLSSQLALLPEFALVALDPEAPADNNALANTEEIVAGRWKALRSKFPDTPVQLLRAVILHALYNVGVSDPLKARIIYMTSANFFPYAKLGREKKVVADILMELGGITERHAAEEWSFMEEAPELAIGKLSIEGLKIGEISIDKSALREKLILATKHPQSHNPYQHIDSWATNFADNASEGIVSSVSSGFEQLKNSLAPGSISDPINKFFSDFRDGLNEVLKSSHASIRAVERRSKLLWWKQSLYSPSLKNSYRSVAKHMQPIVMAVDLVEQLPTISPVSVEFLLRDTVISLNNTAETKMSFKELFSFLNNEQNKLLLQRYLVMESGSARITVTNFLAKLANEAVGVNTFKEKTGIAETEQLSLDDLAVIVIRDLLTRRLIK
jgi:hypothetical protein